MSILLYDPRILSFGSLVAGAWSERKKMFLGGSFLKLAKDNKYIKDIGTQKLKIGRLGGFEKIEFENFTL